MKETMESSDILQAYMSLAAAIVESGRKQHDVRFMTSSWCQFLTDTIADYARHRVDKPIFQRRPKTYTMES